MALSVLALSAAVVTYGLATLQLSRASTAGHVLRHPRWWFGVALQGVGFVLTFLARHQLPLLLVQPILTTSLVVTTVVGAAQGLWRLSRADVLRCLLVVAGVALLAVAARPGPAGPLGVRGAVTLTAAELDRAGRTAAPASSAGPATPRAVAGRVCGAGLRRRRRGRAGAGRRPAAPSCARPSAAGRCSCSWPDRSIGEAALTVSLRTGQVGGPVSAMYVVSTVGPSVFGLLWLGDQMAADGWPLAVVGTTAALVGSLGLTDHGYPAPPPGLEPAPDASPGASATAAP